MRRLMAVIALDIVGYSRMMAKDEEGTLNAWRDLRGHLNPIFADHACRVVKSTGDGLLVEASSVIEGTRAAIEVQHEVESWNRARGSSPEFNLRIGVNLGDVIVEEDGDIYGDGVNVAARLEALADAGGICLSDAAYQQVKGRLDARFEDRGEQFVKNIPTPVRVWAVATGPVPAGDELNLGIGGIGQAVAVGRGGNATVYRAHQASMDRTVAIKVLDSSDAATRRRFDRERQAMGRLSQHPGIITIYDSGYTSSGRPYLVMPYFESGSLQDRLEERGAMAWEEAVAAIASVADAVDHAHQQGIIHRDLKPSNIMVDSQGRPHVADFGIALLADWSQTYTEQLVLTPAYSAPELLDGVEPTVASDVYALAASLAALIAGSPPFMTGSPDRDGLLALSRRIAEEPPPDLTGFGVPKDVNAAIQRSMAKDPADRPESAARFAAELAGTVPPPRDRPEATRLTQSVPRTDSRSAVRALIDRIPGRWASLGVVTLIAVTLALLIPSVLSNNEDDPIGAEPQTSSTIAGSSTSSTNVDPPDDEGTNSPPAAWSVSFEGDIGDVVAASDVVYVAAAGSLRAFGAAGEALWPEPVSTTVEVLTAGPDRAYYSAGTSLVKSIDRSGDIRQHLSAPLSVQGDQFLVVTGDVLLIAWGIGVEGIDAEMGSRPRLWSENRIAFTSITALAGDEGFAAVGDTVAVYSLDPESGDTGQLLALPDNEDVEWLGVRNLGGASRDIRVVVVTRDDFGDRLLRVLDGRDGQVLTDRPVDVSGIPTLRQDELYVADVDGELVAYDLIEGIRLPSWTDSSGLFPTQTPVVSGSSLYIVEGDELVSVNPRSGTELDRWSLPERPTAAPIAAGDLIVLVAGSDLFAVAPPG